MYLSPLHQPARPRAAALPVRIEGTGAYRPRVSLSSDQIDARLGWPRGRTAGRFQIDSRGVAGADETTSFMAAEAGRAALAAAGIAADEVDLVLAACGVAEQPIPATAVLVHARLGLAGSGIPAYDIGATCLSFIAALDHAALKIAAGQARRVLVVAADIASAGLDWSRPEGAAIFGDGAAAAVLGHAGAPDAPAAGDGSALLAMRFETWSEGRDACVLAAGGTRINPSRPGGIAPEDATFQMDGATAFRISRRRLPRFLRGLLDAAGITRDRIDAVIPHQASAQALEHARDLLGFRHEQMVDIFADHGNQIAASLPSALHHAIASGRLRRGQVALLLGTSAGISLGSAVLRF
ncbi:MAG: 3-oxoacyl-[acyl-carrier-protein] synthase III C-terminal domain-containing protein [Paracoccus sp. (in: a-proteobacteria)]|nr:3-oxoacyl-[acyl-carrier-protein] synthase III C-terminal domain-containing protein [Paracoccus sp. (in: a-proteobacteria)]